MGKFSMVVKPEGFDKRYDELRNFSDAHINALWITNGSRTLGDYKCMQMYWSKLNGWACIDNAEGKDAPADFKIFFPYEDAVDVDRSMRMIKIACILASEFGIEPTITVCSSPAIEPEPTAVTLYYNCPTDPKFAVDFANMHDLCRTAQVSHQLEYLECSNLWSVRITSSVEAENYMTKDHSLSLAIQDAVEHLESIQPPDYAPDWPNALDLAED